ncbi:ATP-binding cassette domain-containing protein [Streptomyces sp. NPDC090306]|uniref:ABC transporter ATP-binding protein n=1 Tax=Streptomyces sp. NPDC090306 TaxID=3365961 RepID=UPI003805DE30
MIQAFGLTSIPRKGLAAAAVDDVSFDARAGRVTALLGAPGAGKTTLLRLMLELEQGRGITRFRGRPLHRIAHPSREVGVLLGDVPGHPARTVRGHLRMLCAAAGVPVRRADEVLEVVGLVGLREERLGTLSHGMDRRLGLACALLCDPHTLVLDEPTARLAARESGWLHATLRAHVTQGGTVLFSTSDAKEAARTADRVVTLDGGRLVADQDAVDFARTRLRPRVAVRSPHAARLAALLTKEARAARRSVEVVREEGNRLSVYGSTCADVGDTAFRHGILVHQLAHETGDMGLGTHLPQEAPTASAAREPEFGSGPEPAPGPPGKSRSTALLTGAVTPGGDTDSTPTEVLPAASPAVADTPAARTSTLSPIPARNPALAPNTAPAPTLVSGSALPPPISVRSAPGPLRPLRYELRRTCGTGTGFLVVAVALAVSVVTAVIAARIGHTPQPRLLAAWPRELPLPAAALGAGLVGALAFGDEFRHPALAADRGTVPRRLGLLTAKLVVASAVALVVAVLAVGCDAAALYLFYGRELAGVPADWLPMGASWAGFVAGCACAGVLAAGLFRSTTAGLAAVVAVPVLVVPLLERGLSGPEMRTAAGFPARLREVLLLQWPFGGDRYVVAAARVVAQPVATALTLSLATLAAAYVCTTLRGRLR